MIYLIKASDVVLFYSKKYETACKYRDLLIAHQNLLNYAEEVFGKTLRIYNYSSDARARAMKVKNQTLDTADPVAIELSLKYKLFSKNFSHYNYHFSILKVEGIDFVNFQ